MDKEWKTLYTDEDWLSDCPKCHTSIIGGTHYTSTAQGYGRYREKSRFCHSCRIIYVKTAKEYLLR